MWFSRPNNHDDVIKWKHFPRYWPFVGGNPTVVGRFPSQKPVTRSFDFFLWSAWTNGWANNRWFETPLRWRHCNVTKSNCLSWLSLMLFQYNRVWNPWISIYTTSFDFTTRRCIYEHSCQMGTRSHLVCQLCYCHMWMPICTPPVIHRLILVPRNV